MSDNNEQAAYLVNYIEQALERLKDAPASDYTAFIHGQVYGIAMALRLLFPGPGNWGEKAAFKIRPVLTEQQNCE